MIDLRRLTSLLPILLSVSLLWSLGCNTSSRSGPSGSTQGGSNNATSGVNNATTGSNNATTGPNNSATNNSTNNSANNNATTGPNNSANSTNNSTSGTNNTNNSAQDALVRCQLVCDRAVACPGIQRACDAEILATFQESCRQRCAEGGSAQREVLALESQACSGLEATLLRSSELATQCDVDLCAESMCGVGMRCEPASGACVPFECLPDPLEGEGGNEDYTAAVLLPLEDAAWDDLTICEGDEDWFRLELPAGTALLIQARFLHSQGDIDLVLLDEEGFRLDASTSSTDDEFLFIQAQEEDFLLYLQIDGYRDASNAYSLQLDFQPEGELCAGPSDCEGACDAGRCASCTSNASCGSGRRCRPEGTCVECLEDAHCPQEFCSPEGLCVPCYEDSQCGAEQACIDSFCVLAICADPLEPNSAATPRLITAGRYERLYLCDAKSDFYAIELSEGDSLHVTVEFSHALADIDAYLTGPGGQTLDVGTSFNDDEHLGAPELPAGRYGIRIRDGVFQESPYVLSVEVNPAFRPCAEDDDCPGGACSEEARCP